MKITFQMHEDWSLMLVLNGNVATDSFFLLSGILLSYTFLRKSSKDESTSINIGKLYLNRYLRWKSLISQIIDDFEIIEMFFKKPLCRLTPAYAVTIGFYMTIFEKIGSGPRWDNWVHKNKVYCRENWWTNLLYINNYINLNKIVSETHRNIVITQ